MQSVELICFSLCFVEKGTYIFFSDAYHALYRSGIRDSGGGS
jgi:hypothetical protein